MNTHKGGHRARHSICLLPFPSERESDGISVGADVKCSTFLSSVHPPLLAQKRMDGMGMEGREEREGTMDYF